MVLKQFFAQGVTINSQPLGGFGLVVVGVLHDPFKERLFNDGHQHVIHSVRLTAIQITQISFQVQPNTIGYGQVCIFHQPSCLAAWNFQVLAHISSMVLDALQLNSVAALAAWA